MGMLFISVLITCGYTGLLSWDALSTISNSILVLALVLITYWYAKKVSEQTDLMVKDREKNKILEEVQDVLTPKIHLLETEIEAIRDNKILWYRNTSGGYDFNIGLSKLFYDDKKECAVRDITGKFPDLGEMFSSHDALYDKVNNLYAEIEREIKTTKLKERLKALVNKFNESREEAYRVRGEFFDESERIFVKYIINFRYPIERSPETIQPCIDFWEEYRDELLKFRNTPRIEELDKEIEGILSQLRGLDGALLEKIAEIREKYRVKYNFTKYEIDPKLREVEEWWSRGL
jgi:phage host-nuclease inhibitor protein Gam